MGSGGRCGGRVNSWGGIRELGGRCRVLAGGKVGGAEGMGYLGGGEWGRGLTSKRSAMRGWEKWM